MISDHGLALDLLTTPATANALVARENSGAPQNLGTYEQMPRFCIGPTGTGVGLDPS
jgi:hypothetical protein